MSYRMKFFVLILFVMSFVTSEVHANYAYAQAGVGYYGGTVPCPYGNGGVRRGDQSKQRLEAKLEEIELELEEKKEELEDMQEIDHKLYDEDNLPLKTEAASVALVLASKETSYRETLCSKKDDGTLFVREDVRNFHAEVEFCSLDEEGYVSFQPVSRICTTVKSYDTSSKPFNSRYIKECNDWISDTNDLEDQVADLEKEKDDTIDDLRKIEKAEYKQRRRDEDRGYSVVPEGVQCTDCYAANPEPKGPSGWQIAGAAATDIINGVLMYRGLRYVSDQNAALGWDTSPLALGAYYPHATARLYSAYRGGGQGAGSWGCAQTINGGYPNGAAGIWGPNGPYSQYGNAGGPFYAPQGCNYGCVNPYAGNGPFMPGIGQWGAAGPWGSNGVFPYNPYGGLNAYANLGINLGGGNPYGNPFGGGLFGGNPLGGLYGQGGLGLYGQGQFGNPFGGQFGGGQFGNPYGGIFGGNPYGNPFGGGNMYGNPFGGGQFGLGNDYQMQMMQMQMQQQQAYFQAQQRALQNQMVVSQQVYGLQMEYQQLMQRYQRIMQYSAGGYLGGNVSIYGNLQLGGSYNPYSSQYYVPGSNITNPPNGDSSTGR